MEFEKAINVIDINKVGTDLNTQETYRGISFEVTGASRTMKGIPFVGHDYEAGQEVHIYVIPLPLLSTSVTVLAVHTPKVALPLQSQVPIQILLR